MKTAIQTSLILGLVATLASCGEKKKETSSTATELEGTWTKSCALDEGQKLKDSEEYSIEKNVFSGSNLTFTNETYSDSGCTTKTKTVVMEGTFTVGDAVTTPAGAKKITLTQTKESISFEIADAITHFNDNKECGGGWEKGTLKEINSTNCKDSKTFGEIASSLGQPFYNIFKIDGGKLYYGAEDETNDGSTADKIPTALDTKGMTKQ